MFFSRNSLNIKKVKQMLVMLLQINEIDYKKNLNAVYKRILFNQHQQKKKKSKQ